MKKLCEWKHGKKSTEGREKLLIAYLSAPIPLKDPDWSMLEEIKLKVLLTEDMYAKPDHGVTYRASKGTNCHSYSYFFKKTQVKLLLSFYSIPHA